QAAHQPGMRGQHAPLTELGEPGAELVERIHRALELELEPPAGAKPALAQHPRHRAIGGVVLVEALAHHAETAPATAHADADVPMLRRGTEIHEDATGTYDPVGFAQGMDHALSGHSSEGPGEHHGVEVA